MGASHHGTTDLVALNFHESYTISDSVIIGDGLGLSIASIGSFFVPSLPTPLLFSNVLHVTILCVDNSINDQFFYSFFQMQDRHTWVPLVHGQRRDDVYYWLKLVPFESSALVMSSSIRSTLFVIFMWHNHLSHLSLPIFCKFLSVLSISFSDEHLCSFS